MKTLIIYYSYSGKTKVFAEKKAHELDAKACQVMEKKARSKFNAYVLGSHAAMRQKQSGIIPLDVDLMDYDKIVIAGPIWAGLPAPAVNSIISLLPTGKEVEVYFTSGSGKSKGQEKVKNLILEKGCSVSGYHDIKESEIRI
jgi:flavodoxin